MADGYKNFSYGTVATAPSPASTGLTLVLNGGQGADFPTAPFNVTVWPAGVQPRSSNAERARVVTVATDTLTFEDAGGGVRAPQEGSAARSIIVGDQIAYTWGKKEIDDIYAAIAAGAFVVGSSYLVANTVTVALATGDGSEIDMPLSLNAAAGGDLSISGLDSTKVLVATTGWYSLMVAFSVFGTTNNVTGLGVEVNTTGGTGLIGNVATQLDQPSGGVDGIQDLRAYPVFSLTAGDFVQLGLLVSVATGGTYTSFGVTGGFSMTRLA